MQMTGQYRIEAPRETVWQALNDVEVLRQCIPGVEEIEKTSDTSFAAKVRAKVGPVSARFAGEVTLSDLDPPNGYTISGEGKGGAAGFAKGGAKVRLADDGAATLLSYQVEAQVGGKLAQIGSRLIDGTAKKMADDFFSRFAATVGGGAAAAPAVPETYTAPVPPAAPPAAATGKADADKDVGAGASLGVWVTGLLVAVLLLVAIFAL
ncbi:MAG: SRPBCC family protein [Bacteroidota bacterium]|nr:carbon monoxide dehydrogenase subunit G [Kiloniellaceae bacterium]